MPELPDISTGAVSIPGKCLPYILKERTNIGDLIGDGWDHVKVKNPARNGDPLDTQAESMGVYRGYKAAQRRGNQYASRNRDQAVIVVYSYSNSRYYVLHKPYPIKEGN